MINEIKKDLYLLFHKRIFIYSMMILTILFTVLSLQDITSAYTSGFSYQHHFIFAIDYTKHSFLTMFIYTIPIIVVFSFADTWLNEVKMTDILFTRVNQRTYFISKYLISFVSGFLVLVVPLLISFLAEIICLDFHTNSITILPYLTGENNVQTLDSLFSFYSLYGQHPYWYIVMYICFIGVYGGLCATLSFSISLVCKQKVVSYLAVFFCMLLPMFICNYLPNPYASRYIQALISTYAPDASLSIWTYLFWIGIILLSNGMMFYLFKRRDPLE